MIKCPICNTKIKTSSEPSDEYREQMNNINSQTSSDYMFYHSKDDNKKEWEEKNYKKQDKNFSDNVSLPYNKSPEDKNINDFVYAKCNKCGHKIIKFGDSPDIRQDNDIISYENQPVDKNVPANQSPIMGNDYNRIQSATEENLDNSNFKKNKNGIVYK